MLVHRGGDTLSPLGQRQGGQGLHHEYMISAVDGNDRVEVGDRFAKHVERDQGDDNALDIVIEQAGHGSDTIFASVDYALSSTTRIEFLRADAGAAGLALTGNLAACRTYAHRRLMLES